MRDRRLLTQVLIVNLMLVVAAVVGAIAAANPDINLSEKPEAALVLGFAVALTVLFNLYLVQRRFRPLEKLVDQMERVDLSRPGANLRNDDLPVGPEEVERLQQAFRRMLEPATSTTRSTSR
jgi:HAMP domain-containing protein